MPKGPTESFISSGNGNKGGPGSGGAMFWRRSGGRRRRGRGLEIRLGATFFLIRKMRRGGTEKGKGISPSKFGQLGEPAGNRILESHHILLHERILDLGNTDFHDGLLGEKKKSKEKRSKSTMGGVRW